MQSCKRFLSNSAEPILIFDQINSGVFLNEAAKELLKFPEKNISINRVIPLDNCFLAYLAESPPIDMLIVHQLRAPLTSLKWSIELIGEDKLPDSVQKSELIKNISKTTDYLINLVNDLLAVSHFNSNEIIAPKNKSVRIQKIIEETIGLLKPKALEKRQKIIIQEKCDFGIILIDHDLLLKTFTNLLDNAISYGNKNSDIFITIDSDDSRKNYLISVKDTGICISDKDKERIFGRFYRGEEAKREKASGTGLGLYIAKSAAEINGGKIWFQSSENGDTTFFFTVPVSHDRHYDRH